MSEAQPQIGGHSIRVHTASAATVQLVVVHIDTNWHEIHEAYPSASASTHEYNELVFSCLALMVGVISAIFPHVIRMNLPYCYSYSLIKTGNRGCEGRRKTMFYTTS